MATDLQTRPAISKPDAYLKRKFLELGARMRRVDRIAHLLALFLVIFTYALVRGWFDWFAGNSQATWVVVARWLGFAIFLGTCGFVLVRAVRGWFQRVNPYYVAHLLEETVPDAKNSLINWLDLHDEELPTAFQKHLSARAAEQCKDGDVEQTISKRKNWILLSLAAGPIVGLLVLVAISPSSAFGSMAHAFAPFFTSTGTALTKIALVEPKGGDIEVNPTSTITFAAQIDGRIPALHRPDAPKLLYRYQANEDYFTQALEKNDAGVWSTQLLASQLRTGFTYKLTAGDAATPEHRVSVRGRAHVKSFEVAYEQRPYLGGKRTKSVFPNQAAARPIINGMRGAKIELVCRASRPVSEAHVEIVARQVKTDLPCAALPNDPNSFVCRWTLEQSGEFRVRLKTTDGEENADRDFYPIDVRIDETPTVVLAQPGKDVSLPENGFLELIGRASDDIGVRSLTLHIRAVDGPEKYAPMPYRPEKSFRLDDGSYPDALDYHHVLMLDQLKDDNGALVFAPPGHVLEYWLEARDNADYPHAGGNIGKSSVYKITLMKRSSDAALKAEQQDAVKKQQDRQQQQDLAHAKKNADRKNNGGAGSQDPQQELDKVKKETDATQKKLQQAAKQQDEQKKRSDGKGAEPPSTAVKQGPQKSPDSPEAGQKDQTPMSPGDAGAQKDGGKGSGDAKDDGDKKKKNESASPGASKPAPKKDDSAAKGSGDKKMNQNAGDAKAGGDNGMDAPMPPQPRDNASAKDAPSPGVKKSEPPTKEPQHADAKGIEQHGPKLPNKNAENPQPPPDGHAKSGMSPDDAGAAKQGDGGAGQARKDDPSKGPQNPGLDDVLKLHAKLQKQGAEGDAVATALAAIGKSADDPRAREAAQEALALNGRDSKTGKETKKIPNPFGSGGPSAGVADDIKAAVANREFAAKIGQMQLNDLKKRVTPELLLQAGMSEDDWQRYLKNMQTHDALVRQLNAELLRKGAKMLTNSKADSGGARVIDLVGQANDALDRGVAVPPPELNDPIRRLNQRKNP